MFDFLNVFDFLFGKRRQAPLPVLGHTVPLAWYEEKRDQLEEIGRILSVFETVGKHNEDERDTPVQLAKNARDVLTSDTHIIQRLNRENEELLGQLQESHAAMLEKIAADAEAREQLRNERDSWKAKAQKKKVPNAS